MAIGTFYKAYLGKHFSDLTERTITALYHKINRVSNIKTLRNWTLIFLTIEKKGLLHECQGAERALWPQTQTNVLGW